MRQVAHASDFLGAHQAGLLEHADVLLHAGQGHVEAVGEVGDGRVAAREPFQHATAGGIGQRGEGGAEMRDIMLNHLVQYAGPSATAQVLLCDQRQVPGMRDSTVDDQ
jgi:hypothetical protein